MCHPTFPAALGTMIEECMFWLARRSSEAGLIVCHRELCIVILLYASRLIFDCLAQAWFRSATHFMFLADPRTHRIICEPKQSNPAILKVMSDAGMHVETVSYSCYARFPVQTILIQNFYSRSISPTNIRL